MVTQRQRGLILANKALLNPRLIENLSKRSFLNFVKGIEKYSSVKAAELKALRPLIK